MASVKVMATPRNASNEKVPLADFKESILDLSEDQSTSKSRSTSEGGSESDSGSSGRRKRSSPTIKAEGARLKSEVHQVNPAVAPPKGPKASRRDDEFDKRPVSEGPRSLSNGHSKATKDKPKAQGAKPKTAKDPPPAPIPDSMPEAEGSMEVDVKPILTKTTEKTAKADSEAGGPAPKTKGDAKPPFYDRPLDVEVDQGPPTGMVYNPSVIMVDIGRYFVIKIITGVSRVALGLVVKGSGDAYIGHNNAMQPPVVTRNGKAEYSWYNGEFGQKSPIILTKVHTDPDGKVEIKLMRGPRHPLENLHLLVCTMGDLAHGKLSTKRLISLTFQGSPMSYAQICASKVKEMAKASNGNVGEMERKALKVLGHVHNNLLCSIIHWGERRPPEELQDIISKSRRMKAEATITCQCETCLSDERILK
ncbi:MAG: hypothetical protein ACPHEP_12565 [Acidimicrobiales bacterium]